MGSSGFRRRLCHGIFIDRISYENYQGREAVRPRLIHSRCSGRVVAGPENDSAEHDLPRFASVARSG